MSYSMHWELFIPIRGRTEMIILPTIDGVSGIKIKVTKASLTRKNILYQLILRKLSMSLPPSCTTGVTHGVMASVTLYSQKMGPLVLPWDQTPYLQTQTGR